MTEFGCGRKGAAERRRADSRGKANAEALPNGFSIDRRGASCREGGRRLVQPCICRLSKRLFGSLFLRPIRKARQGRFGCCGALKRRCLQRIGRFCRPCGNLPEIAVRESISAMAAGECFSAAVAFYGGAGYNADKRAGRKARMRGRKRRGVSGGELGGAGSV